MKNYLSVPAQIGFYGLILQTGIGDQVSGKRGDQEALDGALELARPILVVESLISQVFYQLTGP